MYDSREVIVEGVGWFYETGNSEALGNFVVAVSNDDSQKFSISNTSRHNQQIR
jgi:hypothetical protein